MFIGHFGVGFGAKRVAPRVSLGTLFLAAQFADLLWPTFLLLGIERVRIVPGITAATPLDFEYYPYTHSLLFAVIWGVVVGGVYQLLRRYARGALVVGAAVVSHWVLDLIVHRPDLPLFPGSATRLGFGLWNSIGWTLVVELAIFAAGVWLYTRTTTAADGTGRWAFVGLVVFLLVIHLMNVFGAPPPSVAAIAWVGEAQWLIVAWGYWVDRHRRAA
jgi:LexA-binding, inner membrane-associated putative hydrolase